MTALPPRDLSPGAPREPAVRSPGRLFFLLAPAITASAAVAALAVVAGAAGWHREDMFALAAIAACAAAMPALFVAYRQVTERRSMDVELQNVRARVGGIVESAMDAVVAVDESQRIVLFNAAAEQAFRRPRATVMGQHLDILIPERFRAVHHEHIEHFGRAAITSRSMGGLLVIHGLRADGEEFPIEASISQHSEDGRKIFTVILRDVTQRVQAADALTRSESRLRGILDSAMDAIITVDDNHHVVLFNTAAESVFGWTREQAIGAPLEAFIPPRFRDAHVDHLAQFGSAGTRSRRMGGQRIVSGLRRNGEEFPIDASISQIAEGGRRFYTVILRDVTRRVHDEEELRRSREEIRELARAATDAREQEKTRIARELHDELGQSLTALKMDVDWLRGHAGAGGEASDKLDAMHALIDGTVAAARRISSDLRPLMLDDLGLAAAVEWLVQNFTARTGIACILQADEADLELQEPHATAVFRVLQESLTNVARHAEATRTEVTVQRERGQFQLTVEDNGRGFASGGPRKPGSHGLMGMRERAYLLDGEVSVSSAPGRGTRVHMRLTLPAAQA